MPKPSFFDENYMETREGDEPVFTFGSGGDAFVHLKGYAIIPLEKYRSLLSLTKAEIDEILSCMSYALANYNVSDEHEKSARSLMDKLDAAASVALTAGKSQ